MPRPTAALLAPLAALALLCCAESVSPTPDVTAAPPLAGTPAPPPP
ncbi:MAG: PEP-CTERM sorting domain-containing protein, partial [Deltaproteobacteria bacterium]|nr:PEP-CTERM sorting domain-containing protein [Deltaproteobacteria bacterium]